MFIKSIKVQTVILLLSLLAGATRGWPPALDPDLEKALTEAELPFAVAVRTGLREAFAAARSAPLSDIFFAADANSTVRLHNLRLETARSLRVLELSPDLSLLSAELKGDLASLQVQGDCADDYRGNISVTLDSVSVSGAVALGLEGDIFLARGVQLSYDPQEVVVRVTYFGSDDSAVTKQFVSDTVEGSLVESFFDDLTYQLDELLRGQIGDVLRNISVEGLLGDASLVATYEQYTRVLGEALNGITDGVLATVGGDLRRLGQESVTVPDIRKRVTPQGEFSASGGSFRSLASLQRAGDVSVTRLSDGGVLAVSCVLRLREARLTFDRYEVRVQRRRTIGALAATLGDAALSLRASLDTVRGGGCTARLRRLRLARVGDVRLEELRPRWLQAQATAWLAGVVKGVVAPEVEKRLAAAMEQALKGFQCGLDYAG